MKIWVSIFIFQDFLLSFVDVPFVAIVTIGKHSSLVMFNEKWQVFVPYGNIEFLGRNIKNASCCVFETVDTAIAFLMKTKKDTGHCHVAVPHIIGLTSVYEDDVDIDNSSSHETFKAKTSSVCPDKSENTDNEECDDPFISMLGGFGNC